MDGRSSTWYTFGDSTIEAHVSGSVDDQHHPRSYIAPSSKEALLPAPIFQSCASSGQSRSSEYPAETIRFRNSPASCSRLSSELSLNSLLLLRNKASAFEAVQFGFGSLELLCFIPSPGLKAQLTEQFPRPLRDFYLRLRTNTSLRESRSQEYLSWV